jgi:hypothetical protein
MMGKAPNRVESIPLWVPACARVSVVPNRYPTVTPPFPQGYPKVTPRFPQGIAASHSRMWLASRFEEVGWLEALATGQSTGVKRS